MLYLCIVVYLTDVTMTAVYRTDGFVMVAMIVATCQMNDVTSPVLRSSSNAQMANVLLPV